MAEVNPKNIHAGHRERMRNRFQAAGFDNFQPHEVLEVLLYEFIPVRDTNPHGHALIDHFGSVLNVLTASPEELTKVPGIGTKTAERIARIYPQISCKICEYFRETGVLMRYDLAFLADWFMSWLPAGGMGLILCGHDRCFRDFAYLKSGAAGDSVFELAEQIVRLAEDQAYYLLVKEDASLLPKETLHLLRAIAGAGHAYMLDAFVSEGYRLVSIVYP